MTELGEKRGSTAEPATDRPVPLFRPPFGFDERAALLLLALAIPASLVVVYFGQGGLNRYLVDNYYYFEAAKNIREMGLPVIDWPQGPQNKYFPGYSYVLAIWSAVTFQPVHDAWRSLQLLLLLGAGVFTAKVFFLWGMPRTQAILGGALTAGNVVLLRWSAIPMTEMLCLNCLLVQAILVSGHSKEKEIGRVIAFCLLAGLAVATRFEAAYFQPWLLLLDRSRDRLFWWKWGRLALWTVLGLGPVLLWAVWASSAQAAPYYVGEGVEYFSLKKSANILITGISTTVRYYQFPPKWVILHFGFLLFWIGFVVVLVITPRGLLGRDSRIVWYVLLGYWVMHSLWYYESERYNVLVMPLIYFLVVRFIAWFAVFEDWQTAHIGPRAWRFWSMAVFLVLLQLNGDFVIADHNRNINTMIPDRVFQDVNDALPPTASVILSDLGPELAYWTDVVVYFPHSVDGIWRGIFEGTDEDPGRVLYDLDIQWVVLYENIEEYPELAELLERTEPIRLELTAEAVVDLYEVIYQERPENARRFP